jgi:outer membrane receptor for ferrienterochelin and colicins
MIKISKIVITILSCLILNNLSNIYAQDSISNVLQEVVVTGQYMPQLEKNSLYNIQVLKENNWQNNGTNNIRELLQNQLNLSLAQNTVFGSSVEINGVSKENIKILIDGVPVIGRLNGIIDLMQISLCNIEKVEIIHGPVSVFYGTDAMGGVVNLISKKNQIEKWNTEISTYYESINAVRSNVKIGHKFGKNLISAHGEIYHFNGLTSNMAPRSKNWESRNSNNAGLQYRRNIKQLQLHYLGNIFFEELTALGDTVVSRTGIKSLLDNLYYTKRIDNTLRLNGNLSNNIYLESNISYSDYKRYHDAFNINLNSGESVLSTNDTRENNQELFNMLNFKVTLAQNKNDKPLTFAIGTDIYNETANGERIKNKTQDIFTTAVFGSINYVLLNKVDIQPSARFTYNDVYGTFISPAGNILYKINNNTSLRLSYARGFRAPSIKELFLDFKMPAGPIVYNILGNTDLKVEKSHNFNLNYLYDLQLNKTKIRLQPTIFYNEINDLITLSELVDNKRNYINIEKFKSQGFELNINANIKDNLTLRFGGLLIGIYNKYSKDNVGDNLLYTQNYTCGLGYKIPILNTYFNTDLKYFGKRKGYAITKVNNINTVVEITRQDYTNIDCNISKTFLKENIKIAIGAKNMLDIKNVESKNETGAAHSSDMQFWGRSFFINTIFKL